MGASALFQFPDEFKNNIIDICGEMGRLWLQSIPELVEALQSEWRFTVLSMVPNLTYSYVAIARSQEGAGTVLKIAPHEGRLGREIAWYLANPHGTPKIFQADCQRGALLMQRLMPGHSVKRLVQEGNDDKATMVIASAIRELQPKPSPALKHVLELKSDLDSLDGKVDPAILDRTRQIFHDMTLDRSADVSLHGDIHHDNVLAHADGWLVIDPHGYSGPRSFEVGAMIRNPYDCFPSSAPLQKIITRRLDILKSELPFSEEEIRAWTYAHTVLSAAWSVSDHAEIPAQHLEILEIVQRCTES